MQQYVHRQETIDTTVPLPNGRVVNVNLKNVLPGFESTDTLQIAQAIQFFTTECTSECMYNYCNTRNSNVKI